jgi:hypothetical protein
MSPALRFREQMSGFVAFGDKPHDAGYQQGRDDGSRLRLRLEIVVDDVDGFIAGPRRSAMLRGTVWFDELGGEFDVERGEVRLLPGGPSGRGRMYYCVGLRSAYGQSLTVRGFKQLEDGLGSDSWKQLTSLKTRVLYGEPELDRTEDDVNAEEHEATIATGIVRLTAPGLVAALASFRPRARGRLAGGVAVARFWGAFAGGIADLYLPRLFPPEQEEPEPAMAAAADDGLADVEPIDDEREPRLQLALRSFRPSNGTAVAAGLVEEPAGPARLSLEHITSPDFEPWKGPVLLIAGSGVGARIFRPPGVSKTVVHRLVEGGYDVWASNWRASLGQPPREYALDDAAAIDHPDAVEFIREQTRSDGIKAVVHCLGSASFMLALASGRMPAITHVVSNAVSLHPVVPPGAELKIRSLASALDRLMPWWDPQWARDPEMDDRPLPDVPAPAERNPLSRWLVDWVQLTHNECRSDVCNFGNFMYGDGRSTLYRESTLRKDTREWMENQLSWAPTRVYRQIARSLLAGHLVPMREWPDELLRGDLFETGPSTDARITFVAGSENRCFSPRSQQRTCEWFSSFQPGQHKFETLDGFGHLDVWMREDSAWIFDKVIEWLDVK